MCARASAFSSIKACQRLSVLLRSLAVSARQAGQALLAASIARRACSAPRFGTWPISSPVAGLKMS
ncbi:hypothetical protein D3C86_1770720 [compost metagenome]